MAGDEAEGEIEAVRAAGVGEIGVAVQRKAVPVSGTFGQGQDIDRKVA